MKSPLRQRALAVLAGSAVALSTAAIISPAANAATNSYAYSASRWLEDQLSDEGNWGGFDDYGLSLDVFFVLNDLGVRTATQNKIVNAVKANSAAYTTYDDGTSVTFYPGSGGKLALAIEAAGGDATPTLTGPTGPHRPVG